jgi:hypothetical protein
VIILLLPLRKVNSFKGKEALIIDQRGESGFGSRAAGRL